MLLNYRRLSIASYRFAGYLDSQSLKLMAYRFAPFALQSTRAGPQLIETMFASRSNQKFGAQIVEAGSVFNGKNPSSTHSAGRSNGSGDLE